MPKILKARPPHDDGEDQKIRKLAGARHAPADWIERARIVALSWDGLGVPVIAERLGCHPKSVPPGRLARDGAGELSAEREDSPAEWTLDTLTEAARDAGIEVGRSQVRRILRAGKVRWRRTRTWATSTGPDFAPEDSDGPAGRFRVDENGGAHGARRRRLVLALRDRPKD
jgi:hypothetical protein